MHTLKNHNLSIQYIKIFTKIKKYIFCKTCLKYIGELGEKKIRDVYEKQNQFIFYVMWFLSDLFTFSLL